MIYRRHRPDHIDRWATLVAFGLALVVGAALPLVAALAA